MHVSRWRHPVPNETVEESLDLPAAHDAQTATKAPTGNNELIQGTQYLVIPKSVFLAHPELEAFGFQPDDPAPTYKATLSRLLEKLVARSLGFGDSAGFACGWKKSVTNRPPCYTVVRRRLPRNPPETEGFCFVPLVHAAIEYDRPTENLPNTADPMKREILDAVERWYQYDWLAIENKYVVATRRRGPTLGGFLLARYPGQGKSRSFAKFTLSGRARFFASLRMTANGLGMTANGLRMTAWGEQRSTGCPTPP
jgi:hypothetical protein